MNFLRIPLIVLALVGLIAIAGCGDDDSEESTSAAEATETTETTAEALSQEEYVQEVETVLTPAFSELQGISRTPPASAEDLGAQLAPSVDTLQQAVEEFGALQPPEEAQEGHDLALSALEDFSSKLADVVSAGSSGDTQALADAGAQLQEAALEFQEQITAAQEAYQAGGVNFSGSTETDGG